MQIVIWFSSTFLASSVNGQSRHSSLRSLQNGRAQRTVTGLIACLLARARSPYRPYAEYPATASTDPKPPTNSPPNTRHLRTLPRGGLSAARRAGQGRVIFHDGRTALRGCVLPCLAHRGQPQTAKAPLTLRGRRTSLLLPPEHAIASSTPVCGLSAPTAVPRSCSSCRRCRGTQLLR